MIEESLSVYSRFSNESIDASRTNLVNQTVVVLGYLENYGIKQELIKNKLTSFAQTSSEWLTRQAVVFGQATFSVVISFFLMKFVI